MPRLREHVEQAAALLGCLSRVPLAPVLLALRIAVGSVFFNAGLLKYRSWELTLLLFRDEYKVPLLAPQVAARIAMAQELTLPLLLFVGLGTRMATLPLLGMIGVIQGFVYPDAWNEHLLWASVLTLLLLRGPGDWSLDAWMVRRLRVPSVRLAGPL